MPTRNVNLTDDLDRFVERQVESGRFENASEVVQQALQLLKQEEVYEESPEYLEWLRAEAKIGFEAADAGDYVTLRSDEEIEDHFKKQTAEALGEIRTGRGSE